MADKDLTIGIKVTADTKGAADAAKAISDAMEAANKKPFVMPIDEAGLKAREEAIRLAKEEGEAKKWVMPIDEAGMKAREEAAKLAQQEAKAVEKVVEVEKKEATQIQQVTAAQIKSAEVQKTLTTTANDAAKAKSQLSEQSRIYIRETEKAKGKTGEAAMGFMAFSNSVQDAQYGLGGVINNIPGIVSGFGLGMGVAGAVQIAAVGFKVLNDNFDIFGTKAKEASEAANKEAAELMDLANKAYLAEKAALALADAQQKQADSAQQINGHYQEQIRLSNEIIAQKKAQSDAEIASADAESAVAMARLQLMEATGQVTKENAMIQRGQIQMQADARKQAASESAELAKMIELRKQANAEEEKGRSLRKSAADIQQAGGALLPAATEKRVRETVGQLEKELNASQLRGDTMTGFARTKEVQKQQAIQTRLAEERSKLEEHDNAVKFTAAKSQEELAEIVAKQLKEARDAASAASQFRGQANTVEGGVVRGRGIFGLRQEAAAIGTMAGVEGERARQREEAQRAAEKAAADREKQVSQAGAAGSKLAEALAGSANPAFVKQLAGASSSGDIGALIAMMEKLMANQRNLTDQQRSRLQKLEAEIEDLRVAK